METLSERLKRMRTKRNLSLNQMAKLIGISASTYRAWENGVEIRGEPYVRLADIFDISINELMTGNIPHAEKHLREIERLTKVIRSEI